MKYVALLRGVNVGGNRRVEMKKLAALFVKLGFSNVETYLNSGNVIFESAKKPNPHEIEKQLITEFGFDIAILVNTIDEMKSISEAIPTTWKNDTEQRTDVAYLFEEIDSKETVGDLPVKREYINIGYTPGAIYWNLNRKNLGKSQLAKLIGHRLNKLMTMRNVNTARFLGQQISHYGHEA